MESFKVDSTWTLFLDRDGVINRRDFHGYIQNVRDFEFLPGVKEGVQRISNKLGRIIVITNQQGVGKGFMTLQQMEEIHKYMENEFESIGVKIDGIYSATNLRGAANDRRKPKVKMAFEAKEDFPEINFSKSIMVGDTASDIQFGRNLGMKTVLIRSEEIVEITSDLIVNNLIELADELDK